MHFSGVHVLRHRGRSSGIELSVEPGDQLRLTCSAVHSDLIDVPGSHNYGEWSNLRADEIMDALKTEFDARQREVGRVVAESA